MRISDWSSDVCSSDLSKWGQRWPESPSRNWRTTWLPPTLPTGSWCECWRTKNLRHGGCTSIGLSVAPFQDGFERYLMKCCSPWDRCQICPDSSPDAVGHTPWKARSEERRVGNECVSTCRFRWSPDP